MFAFANFMNTPKETTMNESHDDLIDNPTPRCPVALVLDTSGSMSGQPIEQLNAGIELFIDEVKRDDLARWSVDLAVYTAGGLADCIQSFIGVEQIVGFSPLDASGGTPLGQATRMALDDLEARKKSYRDAGVPYYQPWLVLISDGAPDYGWQDAAQRASALSAQRKLVSLPIGVQGADLSVLSQFSSKPAVALDGLKFRELFQWLSASMARVSASTSSDASVHLPSVDSWGSV
ncbi:vWA domain-containing protein [Dechloromonas agitata]|uniref:vWA domain-containing protein n=1 Tax=Dechloromonas agitata TaxID=73030 RepID=UPI0004B15A68|nr:VWA domain-containing protein [Dechloromonas agitata]